uniref:Uncharacterized protein n=1 Tax=Arundo donax TaxID=35708 RepID=A0A0A9SXR9_ARUDO
MLHLICKFYSTVQTQTSTKRYFIFTISTQESLAILFQLLLQIQNLL